MDESWLVLWAALPVYGVIVLGAFLRRVGMLRREMDKGVMDLSVHVLFPALILGSVIGNEDLMGVGDVGMAAGVGFMFVVVGFGIGYLVARMLGMERGEGRRTFSVSTGIQNYGYIAIPLLMAIFPSDDGVGVMMTHNMGVELALWIVGVSILSGDARPGWRMFLKGPIVAVVIGLTLNWTGGYAYVPGTMMKILGMLGPCAIPVALLVIGATFSDLLLQVKFTWRVSAGALFVRLALIPSVMLGLAWCLPISETMKEVVVVQAAMPAALFPIVLAKMYGGRPEVAVQCAVVTNVVCLVTMPFVMAVGVWVLF